MSAGDIRNEIKNILKIAVAETGSSNSEKVYLVQKTKTSGNPITPPIITETDIELVDAIFTQYDINSIDTGSGGSEILAGDRRLVCNSDIVITQSDQIKQGLDLYHVINVDVKAPTSDVLAYILQLRKQ